MQQDTSYLSRYVNFCQYIYILCIYLGFGLGPEYESLSQRDDKPGTCFHVTY